MEIVQEHFLLKKQYTRLFFKVNLNDDIEINNTKLDELLKKAKSVQKDEVMPLIRGKPNNSNPYHITNLLNNNKLKNMPRNLTSLR